MNKELISKRNDLYEQFCKISTEVTRLKNFLKYESLFQDENSIEELLKIKEYYNEKLQLEEKLRVEFRKYDELLRKSCNHEIIIQGRSSGEDAFCAICNTYFSDYKCSFSHYLVSGISSEEIQMLFDGLSTSESDIFSYFSEKIKELDNPKIKVYRK